MRRRVEAMAPDAHLLWRLSEHHHTPWPARGEQRGGDVDLRYECRLPRQPDDPLAR
jgi:hypothetical protein